MLYTESVCQDIRDAPVLIAHHHNWQEHLHTLEITADTVLNV